MIHANLLKQRYLSLQMNSSALSSQLWCIHHRELLLSQLHHQTHTLTLCLRRSVLIIFVYFVTHVYKRYLAVVTLYLQPLLVKRADTSLTVIWSQTLSNIFPHHLPNLKTSLMCDMYNLVCSFQYQSDAVIVII